MTRAGAGVVAAAIVVRAAALVLPGPVLSDDVWRHVWDGRVGASGENPYAHAPADAPTAGRDAELLSRVNHPEHRTIYGPAVQAWATAVASAADLTPRRWRASFLLVEIPVLLLAARRLPPAVLAFWALHPLVVLEGYVDGHSDLLMGALLLASLVAQNAAAAGALFAAAGMTKYWPLAFVGLHPRRAEPRFWLAAGAAAALCLAPYVGEPILDSARAYQRDWEFNASLHALAGVDDWTADKAVARAAVAAAAVAAGYAARSASLGAGLLFLAAPTVYPWYLVGLLPFLIVETRWPAVRLALAVWTFTVPLAHLVHLRPDGAPWEPPFAARIVEYAPVYAILSLAAVRAFARIVRRTAVSTWRPASA